MLWCASKDDDLFPGVGFHLRVGCLSVRQWKSTFKFINM